MHNKVWYLKRSKLFECVTDATVEKSEAIFTETLRPKHALVFEQGDAGRFVYLVKTGQVRIAKRAEDGRETTVAILGPGGVFGEEVMFGDVNRSTTARCIEDSLLCTARGADIYGLFVRTPLVAVNVAKYLADQRDAAVAAIQDLSTLKVPERILKLMEKLAGEFGVESDSGTIVDVLLTHADIANLIGCTRETVSVALGQLTRDKRLVKRGRRFLVPAVAAAR